MNDAPPPPTDAEIRAALARQHALATSRLAALAPALDRLREMHRQIPLSAIPTAVGDGKALSTGQPPRRPSQPGDQRQRAEGCEHAAVAQPQHQQERRDGRDDGVFVFDRHMENP